MTREDNLIPAKKGEVRNPNGKPKGTKHWSTIVRKILNDKKLFEALIEGKQNPKWIASLPNRDASHAIATAMVVKAMQGDKQAAEWLRKTGYGDKLDITSDEKPITVEVLRFVDADERKAKNTTS